MSGSTVVRSTSTDFLKVPFFIGYQGVPKNDNLFSDKEDVFVVQWRHFPKSSNIGKTQCCTHEKMSFCYLCSRTLYMTLLWLTSVNHEQLNFLNEIFRECLERFNKLELRKEAHRYRSVPNRGQLFAVSEISSYSLRLLDMRAKLSLRVYYRKEAQKKCGALFTTSLDPILSPCGLIQLN